MSFPQYVSLVFSIPVKREFTYKIPSSMEGKVVLGMRVQAKFRNRLANGFVVAFVEKPSFPKINPLIEILDKEPLIGESILKLTRWMAHYYSSSWGNALDMALPSGVKKNSKGRKEKLVSLDPTPKEPWSMLIQKMETKSPKGARVLRILQEAEQPLRIQSLATSLKITQGPIKTLIHKGLLQVTERHVTLDPYDGMEEEEKKEVSLTEDQEKAFCIISKSLDSGDFGVFLLHGVTGSGKTEIYLRSIAKVLKAGKTAIILIPEISLTPQTMKRFKSWFGNQVAVLHSNLTDSQRYHQWHLIHKGSAKVVIGPRSAIFAPLQNLGIVIVDEEHEGSFKENSSPRYHGRDVAIMRAHLEKAQVILGSATPSLISYYNGKINKYSLLTLPKRATLNPLPEVEVVDMRIEYEECKRLVLISRRMKFLIEATIKDGYQVILFLNRRGFSTYIFCNRCKFILKCKYCDITLTFHKRSKRAVCHYCGFDCSSPKECPDCLGASLKYWGTGTEKVEDVLARLFPKSKIARLDSDTMTRKGGYVQTLESFRKREIDILVGTQIIAKGLDFPGVGLVGVISADVGLHLPDFYAAERTFQLLTQVAGRAGRGDILGRVVIQTMVPDHYSIVSASKQDYEGFVQKELSVRKIFGYPPFSRLVRIVLQGKKESEVSKLGLKIRNSFPKEFQKKLLGPAPCPIAVVKEEYRFQILGKFSDSKEVKKALSCLKPNFFNNKIKVRIDVDPVGML